MLISYKHKFIFVHVYKVAGTSIRQALAPFCVPSLKGRISRKLFGYPKFSIDFDHHIKATEIKEHIGDKTFNNFFKFAFVRNPWDWQVSLYHFTLQNPDHFQHEVVKKLKGFEEYIDWRVHSGMCYQSDFTHAPDGAQLVDYIGKIETIDDNFREICNRLGIVAELPVTNQSAHHQFEKYYTKSTYKMIEEAYSDEIKIFQYDQ